MKKITILFLLLPLLSISRQKPAGWLTPYADARFENGKIIYTLSNLQQHMNTRLLPLMLPRDLVQLRIDNHPTAVTGKYIGESQTKIRDYLATEPVNLRGEKEKKEYLRLSAMVLLWDLKLPDHCLNELKQMQTSGNRELKKEAGLVMAVKKIFDENRKR